MKNKILICVVFMISSYLFCDDFIYIKAGVLQIQGQKDNISLDSFYMCKHEVTQKEWMDVMGSNPSYKQSDSYPVNMISWIDAVIYCNKRSIKEGLTPCYEILDSKITINYDIPWE